MQAPRPSKFFTDRHDHERGKRKHQKGKVVQLPKRPKRTAIDPAWLQQFIAEHGPYLYHYTAPDAAPHILQEGLYPHDVPMPGEDPEHFGEPPMEPGEIREYGPQYTPSRSKWAGQYFAPRPGHTYMGTKDVAERSAGYKGTALRVDLRHLDPANINADEDFAADAFQAPYSEALRRLYETAEPPSVHDFDEAERKFPGAHGIPSLGQWAHKVNLGQDPELTKDSLQIHGTLGYNGVIPPQALSYAEQPCPQCEGRRWINGETCPMCHGSGEVDGKPPAMYDCPACKGHGDIPGTDLECYTCHGSGQVSDAWQGLGYDIHDRPLQWNGKYWAPPLGQPMTASRRPLSGSQRAADGRDKPWEGKMYHGNSRGHVGPVRIPFWTTSHEPEAVGFGGGEDRGTAHPVQVRFRNPAMYFGALPADWRETAEVNRNDGIVVHFPEDLRDPSDPYPKRQWAIALDPGTVVPGHLKDPLE